MGNVCTKGDASVSALDTTYSREDLCNHRCPRNQPVPCLEKDFFSTSALEVSMDDAPASSTATFCSIQIDGNSMSAGANASGKDSPENQRSAIDIQIPSRSGSALRRKRADPSESLPHPTAVLDADMSGADSTTDKLFSGSMGPTTHHTVSGEFGQRTPGASSLADDSVLGGVVKATTVKPAPLRDVTPPTTDFEPITHPNAVHCATDTEEQTVTHDSEEFESRSIHFSAPASPLANPLQVWRHGTRSGLTDGHTPSTHVGPVLRSNSSSVVERDATTWDAVTCDVHIEMDSSSLSESSCGFEVMLRALQPPTAAERAEAIRHWADLVPATPIELDT